MNTSRNEVKRILNYTFGVVPIVAGLDKFTNILADWSDYLSTNIESIIPFEATTFMVIVGIIEIVAGMLVLIRPKLGAIVVMAWLIGIALTLIVGGHYLDVAVRDLVMAISAFCLYKLSGKE